MPGGLTLSVRSSGRRRSIGCKLKWGIVEEQKQKRKHVLLVDREYKHRWKSLDRQETESSLRVSQGEVAMPEAQPD